ncbi:hypothetical protein [Corynebacterium sp. 13CS0277]|uniref:hypothetical protein n=1 Tax=Corynebacterium sp. 13CS0277 TaxID=2071994 RepID=UPI0011B1D1B3|nr:hypothetical protein [Corynebacterium sp. 13CS0277]
MRVLEPRDPNYPPEVFAVAFFEEDRWCTFLPTGETLPPLTTAGESPVPWPDDRLAQWCEDTVCEVVDQAWVADATELWKAHAFLADGEVLCMMKAQNSTFDGYIDEGDRIFDKWIGDVTPEMMKTWACPSIDDYDAEREAMRKRMEASPELRALYLEYLAREGFYVFDVLGVDREYPNWPVRRWAGMRARRLTPPPNYPELYPDLQRIVPVDSFTYTPL